MRACSASCGAGWTGRPRPCTNAAVGNWRAPRWPATPSRAGICWTTRRAWQSAPSTRSARGWCAACRGCPNWAACPTSPTTRAPITKQRPAPRWTWPTTTTPCASCCSIWTWTCKRPRTPSPTCWVSATNGCRCCATVPTEPACKPCWPRPSAKTWTRFAKPCLMAGPTRCAARPGWRRPTCKTAKTTTSCWRCWTGRKSCRPMRTCWTSGAPWPICC
ncbi:hypothetical protein D3C72_925660 [compost metagenome]